jgi:hydrogenase maturation protease
MTTKRSERGRTCIIGYGSPIRGDDAVGPLVADRLASEALPAGTQVISRHVLTADLVPEVARSDLVIFLDASVQGAPGRVDCQRLSPASSAGSTMAHFLDPRELLAWSSSLYQSVPEAWLVSVTGTSFDFAGYSLSPEVEAGIAPMLRKVRELLGQP